MNEFKHRLIHLHHCRGVNWNSILTILKKDPDLHRLYQNEIEISILLSPAIKNTLKDDLQSQRIRNTINEYEKKGHSNDHDIRTGISTNAFGNVQTTMGPLCKRKS